VLDREDWLATPLVSSGWFEEADYAMDDESLHLDISTDAQDDDGRLVVFFTNGGRETRLSGTLVRVE